MAADEEVSDVVDASFSVPISRLSVRAILSGLVVAMSVQLVLMLLGAAIGLSAFEPSGEVTKGVGAGLVAWTVLSLCVSAFIGAWLAGIVARSVSRRDGLIHGLVLWALVSVIGASMVGGAISRTLSGVFGLLGTAATAAAQSPAVNQNVTPEDAQRAAGGAASQARGAARQLQARPEVAHKAATGAAIGLWGGVVALILPLGAALAGGWLASRGEAQLLGVIRRREEREVMRPMPGPPVPVT
jgi:hypothetical protein